MMLMHQKSTYLWSQVDSLASPRTARALRLLTIKAVLQMSP